MTVLYRNPCYSEGSCNEVDLYNPMGLYVAINTRILIRSSPNLSQPFARPNDASDKILLRLAHWSTTYSCLKVWAHGRRLESHPISSPCEPSAQVS